MFQRDALSRFLEDSYRPCHQNKLGNSTIAAAAVMTIFKILLNACCVPGSVLNYLNVMFILYTNNISSPFYRERCWVAEKWSNLLKSHAYKWWHLLRKGSQHGWGWADHKLRVSSRRQNSTSIYPVLPTHTQILTFGVGKLLLFWWYKWENWGSERLMGWPTK